MKQSRIYFLVCALFLFSLVNAFASSRCERTYISPDKLMITEEGIFVLIDGEWVPSPSLLSDSTGIYIPCIRMRPKEHDCKDPYVPCRNCRRCVHEEFNYCPYCERPV
ncbi:MAG: hypothetical protein JSS61_05330 [Verrucomicrobia bacterium]|nr:hypothetical protein [Verrucomicrobiota bacterium]